MLHSDYQYTPRLIGAMAWPVASGQFDVVPGSRILRTEAIKGGMPPFKYVANRFLAAVENILLGSKLSESMRDAPPPLLRDGLPCPGLSARG